MLVIAAFPLFYAAVLVIEQLPEIAQAQGGRQAAAEQQKRWTIKTMLLHKKLLFLVFFHFFFSYGGLSCFSASRCKMKLVAVGIGYLFNPELHGKAYIYASKGYRL